jgi:hypothetical protein
VVWVVVRVPWGESVLLCAGCVCVSVVLSVCCEMDCEKKARACYHGTAASPSGAQPPGTNSSVPWHDTSPLGNFRDPFDGPVYAAAVKLFETRVRQYDASDARCKAMACL